MKVNKAKFSAALTKKIERFRNACMPQQLTNYVVLNLGQQDPNQLTGLVFGKGVYQKLMRRRSGWSVVNFESVVQNHSLRFYIMPTFLMLLVFWVLMVVARPQCFNIVDGNSDVDEGFVNSTLVLMA
ncbi:hypothetical protein JTE90_006456 [Oedothorax gibbosus]|uniref:Uncharacterized protein n=1 Tax=Oedothorax gibbosus TaxID=931172 RepID=A0AAV6UI75_9ARAC|nr:hypothetical protein JTE90_006456 [Oedothorax gibbosus]